MLPWFGESVFFSRREIFLPPGEANPIEAALPKPDSQFQVRDTTRC
jgi:hypothetical protein